MKKGILLVAILLGAVMTSNAQANKFSLGLGLGGSSASSKSEGTSGSGFGFNYYLNGMYNISGNLSVGLEYNSNIVVIVNNDIADLSFTATQINGILAKGKYAFGDGGVNPYVGVMAGLYTIAPGSITVTGAGIGLVFEKKTSFGFAPEVGIELGAFQLATSYHFVGKYSSEIANATVETTYALWQFNIGWNIGIAKN
ncbi:MAG: outer membrane beta-barrel protein [Cyclobacteriaceae bacterium]|nr:outer membrane beta-barrel protein [Cyclobacteriaceae bacterium]